MPLTCILCVDFEQQERMTKMKRIERAAIIGMGSMGILYGSCILERLGKDAVSYPANERRRMRFAEQGVSCNGRDCPFQLVEETADTRWADLVIFAVKATSLASAIDTARKQIGPETTILSLMNGISSEEILGEAFGKEKIIYAVALGMDAQKQGNRITYTRLGKTVLGIPAAEADKSDRLEAVMDFFTRAGLPFEKSEDIQKQLWGKFMLNVGVNQITMVYESTNQVIQQPGAARDLMCKAMKEVVGIAALEHVNLTKADFQSYLAMIDSFPSNGCPSMRQDGMAHRPSEVELFSGTVLRLARKHGVAVPANEEIYRRVQCMEAAY